MEELIAVIMLEEEEDGDLLVYCMSGGCNGHFEEKKKRWTPLHWIGKYFDGQ
jgi:hypothetical protein